MGCDIHLKVERRRRNNPYPNEKNEWYSTGSYNGEFSSRSYGMFARMAGVRDYNDNKMFEPRGLPEGMCWATQRAFYMLATDNKDAAEWGEHYCLKSHAEKWIEDGYTQWVDENHRYVINPDHHSHSWLTTQELRQCFDDCFIMEDGTFSGDYVDWLGLVSLCEGIESTDEYECRVVFAFDN